MFIELRQICLLWRYAANSAHVCTTFLFARTKLHWWSGSFWGNWPHVWRIIRLFPTSLLATILKTQLLQQDNERLPRSAQGAAPRSKCACAKLHTRAAVRGRWAGLIFRGLQAGNVNLSSWYMVHNGSFLVISITA